MSLTSLQKEFNDAGCPNRAATTSSGPVTDTAASIASCHVVVFVLLVCVCGAAVQSVCFIKPCHSLVVILTLIITENS